jgi:hypothetical protein
LPAPGLGQDLRPPSSFAWSTIRSLSALMRLAAWTSLGHGDAELVDQLEDGVLVDEDLARRRHAVPVANQRLEPFEQET